MFPLGCRYILTRFCVVYKSILWWNCNKIMFLTVFEQFLVNFGLREGYMAPRGTPYLVEGLKKPQKWTALVAYVILDTKIFIQLQKLRKLWIKIKRRMKLWLLNHAFLKFFPLNRTRWGSYRHPLHALSSSKEGPWTLLSIALLGARIGHRLVHYPIAKICQKIACPHRNRSGN